VDISADTDLTGNPTTAISSSTMTASNDTVKKDLSRPSSINDSDYEWLTSIGRDFHKYVELFHNTGINEDNMYDVLDDKSFKSMGIQRQIDRKLILYELEMMKQQSQQQMQRQVSASSTGIDIDVAPPAHKRAAAELTGTCQSWKAENGWSSTSWRR
jgi:hypothetical protein